MKRTILHALLVGAAVVSLAAPAFAEPWHNHYRHYHRYYHPYRPGYVYHPYRPGYVYAPPPVVYAPPSPVYAGPSFSVNIPVR